MSGSPVSVVGRRPRPRSGGLHQSCGSGYAASGVHGPSPLRLVTMTKCVVGCCATAARGPARSGCGAVGVQDKGSVSFPGHPIPGCLPDDDPQVSHYSDAGLSTQWEWRGHAPGAAGPGRCLLYTSDAADDLLCVDLGGRRIIKKTKKPRSPPATPLMNLGSDPSHCLHMR